jgi:cobalt/nickel transport system permease protein
MTLECTTITIGVAALGAGWAGFALWRTGLDRRQLVTAAALGALVFAAQTFNVRVLPYSSVHLIGGVLLAWVLGPALGLLTIGLILALQATLLGDGGVLALGANITNMGLIPAALVALVRKWQPEASAGRASATIALTCFVATVAAALAIVAEVRVGRSLEQLDGFNAFASQMVWAHLLAGMLEGIVTVAVVAAIAGFASQAKSPARLSLGSTAIVLAISLLIVLLSEAGFSSVAPDFYESAAQSLKSFEA